MGLTPLPNQRHETSLSQYEGPDEKNWLREVGTGCIPNLMQALQILKGWTADLQGHCTQGIHK